MAYLGPFFYINNKLICNKCTFEQARIQGDKLDNSYGHDRLYDDYFAEGDYIFYLSSNHHLVILLILLYASIIASSLLENRIDNAHRIPLCILPIQIHLQQPL